MKEPNAKAPTVGTIKCGCGQIAAVRKNKNGKLFIFCGECGIDWKNLPGGQDFILRNVAMFGPDGPPADAPEWIREGKTWRHDLGQNPGGAGGGAPLEAAAAAAAVETAQLERDAAAPAPAPAAAPPAAPKPAAKRAPKAKPAPKQKSVTDVIFGK